MKYNKGNLDRLFSVKNPDVVKALEKGMVEKIKAKFPGAQFTVKWNTSTEKFTVTGLTEEQLKTVDGINEV